MIVTCHRDLTVADVAQRTAVSKRTAAKWIDIGLLAGYRLPGSRHRRVQPAALDQFCREHGILREVTGPADR